jgi:type IV secretion system protein VirB9
VQNIALGDTGAWEIAPVHNHIFLKPKADKAQTNMTVLTNRRVYNFELSARWPKRGARPAPNDMFFQVNFRYPEEEAAQARAEAKAKALSERLSQTPEPTPANWNYWVKGAPEVSPSRAFDDGRFTYVSFAPNRAMPAVYIADPDGSERLVNTHVDGETIVVHEVARQLVLRDGPSVACLFNKAFDADGPGTPNATTASKVRRIIKGAW